MLYQWVTVLFIAAFGALSVSAFAADSNQPKNTEAGIISADRVNLRTSPAFSAPVKAQLQLGTWIFIAADKAQTNSQAWRRIILKDCRNENCTLEERSGWVAEEYIALRSSFIPVKRWKKSYLSVVIGDYEGHFQFNTDGTFEHQYIPCFDGNCGANREYDVCQADEVRSAAYCVSKGFMLQKDRLVFLQLKNKEFRELLSVRNDDQLCYVLLDGVELDNCSTPAREGKKHIRASGAPR